MAISCAANCEVHFLLPSFIGPLPSLSFRSSSRLIFPLLCFYRARTCSKYGYCGYRAWGPVDLTTSRRVCIGYASNYVVETFLETSLVLISCLLLLHPPAVLLLYLFQHGLLARLHAYNTATQGRGCYSHSGALSARELPGSISSAQGVTLLLACGRMPVYVSIFQLCKRFTFYHCLNHICQATFLVTTRPTTRS